VKGKGREGKGEGMGMEHPASLIPRSRVSGVEHVFLWILHAHDENSEPKRAKVKELPKDKDKNTFLKRYKMHFLFQFWYYMCRKITRLLLMQ